MAFRGSHRTHKAYRATGSGLRADYRIIILRRYFVRILVSIKIKPRWIFIFDKNRKENITRCVCWMGIGVLLGFFRILFHIFQYQYT